MTRLEIHLLGTTAGFEQVGLKVYEELMHLLPSLQTLVIVMIGPENEQSSTIPAHQLCEECTRKNRILSISIVNAFYHHYIEESKKKAIAGNKRKTADLVVVFNSGIHSALDPASSDASSSYKFVQDSWDLTLHHLVDEAVPALFTSYNKQESQLDVERLRIGFSGRLFMAAQENPFRSLLPLREPDACDAFFYHNYYVFGMCGLEHQ